MATVPEQVKEIAQAAIDSIYQLTSLIEHGPTTASGTLRIPSNAHVAEAADGGKRQLTTSETTFVRQTQPAKAIPIKCFVSHRPPSREGGSVGRAKKKKKCERSLEGVWVPGKAGLLSTKAWLRGPFVRNQMV